MHLLTESKVRNLLIVKYPTFFKYSYINSLNSNLLSNHFFCWNRWIHHRISGKGNSITGANCNLKDRINTAEPSYSKIRIAYVFISLFRGKDMHVFTIYVWICKDPSNFSLLFWVKIFSRFGSICLGNIFCLCYAFNKCSLGLPTCKQSHKIEGSCWKSGRRVSSTIQSCTGAIGTLKPLFPGPLYLKPTVWSCSYSFEFQPLTNNHSLKLLSSVSAKVQQAAWKDKM